MLPRYTELKRFALKAKRIPKDWSAARRKVEQEGRCRRCGVYFSGLEAAHTVGQAYQDVMVVGPRGGKKLIVEPDAVVPLCGFDHEAFDRRRMSLLGLLTFPELRNAVGAGRKHGIDIRRRLAGSRDNERSSE